MDEDEVLETGLTDYIKVMCGRNQVRPGAKLAYCVMDVDRAYTRAGFGVTAEDVKTALKYIIENSANFDDYIEEGMEEYKMVEEFFDGENILVDIKEARDGVKFYLDY